MADDVLRELLVSILTKFDEASNKQALDAVDKQQGKITDKEKKGQSARGKNLASSLAAATKQVGEHSKAVLQFGEKIALGLAGIVTSVESAAVAGTFALARLSGEMKTAYYSGQKLGSAVKDMDAFRYASEQAGSSAAKAQAGLEELGHLRNTNPAAYVGLLQRLGVAATDAAGKLRSPAQAAMDLAPALAKLPRNMQLLFGNQLGMDDDQTLAMVRPEFLAQLQQYKEMQKAIGFDPDRAAADGAKFQQTWTRMWTAVDIVSKKVQAAFFNQVGGSVDHITDLLVKNSGRITDIAIKVGGYVLHLATSIVDLVTNFDKLNPTTQRFIEVMAGVAAVLLTLQTGPIGIIMALAAALAFLWDDYEKYKQGLPSVVDWDKWEPKIKAAIKGLTDLWTKFDDLSLKLTGQGGLQVAMEAFAAYMAGAWVAKLVGAFATVSKAWGPLAAMMAAAGYLANNTGSNVDPWVGETSGEIAARAVDPGLADRIYGKRGEQLPHGPRHGLGVKAAPHDTRTLWQRTMPKILGGKDAPEGAEPRTRRGRNDAGVMPDSMPPTAPQPGDEHAKQAEVASYIRARAAAEGIDPDTAVRVAMSEGLRGWDTGRDGPSHAGDYNTSFGAYQLHYGGSGIPGMNAMGLGDDFTKQTGLDARDPKTWRAQIDFALRRARVAGWTDWHGAANTGISKWQGIGTYKGPVPGNSPKSAAPVGDKAALDAENRIKAGRARSGDAALLAEYRRQQNTPASAYHPDDDRQSRARASELRYGARGHLSPVQYTRSNGANALTALYGSGLLAQGVPALRGPLTSAPVLTNGGGDARSTQVSPQVNQNINIHGVQNPRDIEHHLKTHAKRGVQDAIRHVQGPSQ